jgi:hypothetical protein
VTAGCALWLLLRRVLQTEPVTLVGTVMVRSDDVDKQVPIGDVKVTAEVGSAAREAWSSPTGFFELALGELVKPGQTLILQFRNPQYMPMDVTVLAGDRLNTVRMAPLTEFSPAVVSLTQALVSNVTIRYTVRTTNLVNVGSVAKPFRVVNNGNVPCDGHYPCSPDGKWKATVGTSTLDAPRGNVFSNARVACIAGPCPFTRIRSDGFSRGGPTLRVAILNWSDTTTFLFEAEVFRSMISNSVRYSYPVIFGRTLHFTVPADSEGICIEADVDNDPIVFPLGPQPLLSWAVCSASETIDHSKAYQCELTPGYAFK